MYVPAPAQRCFADLLVQVTTDHMVLVTYDPVKGWSAPEIKPYGPLTLDPMCSCFQYSTNLFEGMKVRLIAPVSLLL